MKPPPATTSNASELIQLFLKHKLTLALAESCTCGLAAATLAPSAGVSDVLLGSVVTYHADAKKKLLGVKAETLKLYSAESQQTTNEMALGLKKQLPQADVHVAITGLCGPGASAMPEKPVGTVFVTVLLDEQAHEYRVQLKGDSDHVRQQAVAFMYEALTKLLNDRHVTTPKS